ncbi:protein phosphatase 1F-like [Ptychodera flava]|uniref:protein phosphatase 1F-like n=1 Tax=Ptychodera flava TaxID=63121 RepID=UPI00396A5A3A
MESSEGTPDTYKQFLSEFLDKNDCQLTSNDPLPIRLVTFSLTREEVEGEALDWALQYLEKSNAPHILALAVARKAVDEILKSNLDKLVQQSENAEETSVIDANTLSRKVFNKVHEVCTKWVNNLPQLSRSDKLPLVSVHAIKNTRRKMEDKHVLIQDMKTLFPSKVKDNQSYYAVFDGHGGVDAASYAAAHLHCHLTNHRKFDTDVSLAIKEAFEKTDSMFVARATRERLRSGSTGIVTVITGNEAHVAWLGDSQALLMKNGKPVTIMEPHKPEREDEKKRIEDLGGCVVWFGAWRVNGTLSVSRALGDAEHKPYVSGEPDTMKIHLDGDEECIILACDGLWDILKPEEVCETIQQYIDSGSDLTSVAHKLVIMAKEGGSNDNITCLVVFLHPHHDKRSTSTNSDNSEKISANNNDSKAVDDEKENTAGEEKAKGDSQSQEQQKTAVLQGKLEQVTLDISNLQVGDTMKYVASPRLIGKLSTSSQKLQSHDLEVDGDAATKPKSKLLRRGKNHSRTNVGKVTRRRSSGASNNGLMLTSGAKNETKEAVLEFARTNSMPSTLKVRRSPANPNRTKSLPSAASTNRKTSTSKRSRSSSTS